MCNLSGLLSPNLNGIPVPVGLSDLKSKLPFTGIVSIGLRDSGCNSVKLKIPKKEKGEDYFSSIKRWTTSL